MLAKASSYQACIVRIAVWALVIYKMEVSLALLATVIAQYSLQDSHYQPLCLRQKPRGAHAQIQWHHSQTAIACSFTCLGSAAPTANG